VRGVGAENPNFGLIGIAIVGSCFNSCLRAEIVAAIRLAYWWLGWVN